VIEPLAHRRAAALELGAKDAFGMAEDLINEAGKGGLPLVIEATNSPSDLGTLCASRIGGEVVLAGIPDGDAYTLSASKARSRGSRLIYPAHGRRLSAPHRPHHVRQCGEHERSCDASREPRLSYLRRWRRTGPAM